MAGLTRTLKLGTVGADVDAAGRIMHRYLQDGKLAAYVLQRPIVRRTFGTGKRTLAKQCAAKAELPQYGVVGPALFAVMRKAGAVDQLAQALLDEYAAEHPALIEPVQGFSSLHRSLWEPYSIGRSLGLFDLGTHNPDSRLPGGGPSDHSVYPAMAFDLGFDPDTGYQHPVARRFYDLMCGHPAVEYVILGDRIWTDDGRGTHPYTAGGHLNHVHVSGHRS